MKIAFVNVIGLWVLISSCAQQPDFKKDGGVRMILEVEHHEGDLTELRRQSETVLQKRLDQFGISSASVKDGNKPNEIIIEIPGKNDMSRLRMVLQNSARLSFYETYDNAEMYPNLDKLNTALVEEGGLKKEVPKEEPKEEEGNSLREQLKKTDAPQKSKEELINENPLFAVLSAAMYANSNGEYILAEGPVVGYSVDTAKVNVFMRSETAKNIFGPYVKFIWTFKPAEHIQSFSLLAVRINSKGEPALSGDLVKKARLVYDTPDGGRPQISMEFNPEPALAWKRITAANIGRSIAITLDDHVVCYPVVQGEISGGMSSITGAFTREEAEDLVNIMNAGYLPVDLKITKEEEVAPQ
ncbi:MAG: protein translocase subunit SecDF [Bacteroidetes bacterium]|jgi:SecD/SecF fusion protein|nr:protein translocase subunit SecDF [Bacteroidota bacterium]